LTLESEQGGCSSSFCLPVFTVSGSDICNFNDCVFPGDANRDGLVNIFDVLNLGVGFNKLGEVRPNAVITPILQAAFDWDIATIFDLNFKHIDCDGNGIVNGMDYEAIDNNYQSITAIVVNANQTNISIPANLAVGTTDLPIDNLYGIALAFNYDNTTIQDIETVYDTSSFVGNNEEILARKKLLIEEGQAAYAITRTNQIGVSGSGNIAEFAFILELDLIEARSEYILELDLIELLVIDSSGREIPITISDDTPTITVIFDENALVNTEEQLLEKQFDIYPNPARERLIIDLAAAVNLVDSNIEVFNSLGQKVLYQSLQNSQTMLDISALKTGVYWVKIYTEEGIGIKEIVVE